MNITEQRTVDIPLENVELTGDLWIPHTAHGIVIFAHGSGSSRLSPRNRQVAEYLNKQGFMTLLFDLLTQSEDKEYANRFNIHLLTKRLTDATLWLESQEEAKGLNIGYFGASTGAAAALYAASVLPQVKAVVSRGGRPDLANEALHLVQASTLLIVGGLDTEVYMLNQKAYDQLHCEKRLEIIPGATHLFEEKGAMEAVCELAAEWFDHQLKPLRIYDD